MLLLTTIVALVVMIVQRSYAWKDAQDEFVVIIRNLPSGWGERASLPRAETLVRRFPSLARLPGAMSWAAEFGTGQTCRLFLEGGADPSEIDEATRVPPLYWAIRHNDPEKAKVLIDYGAVVEQQMSTELEYLRGLNYLHWAAEKGNFEICRYMIDHGADTHATSRLGETILHAAVVGRSPELVRLLLQRQVPYTADSEGQTPLGLAESLKQHNTQMETAQQVLDTLIALLEKPEQTLVKTSAKDAS